MATYASRINNLILVVRRLTGVGRMPFMKSLLAILLLIATWNPLQAGSSGDWSIVKRIHLGGLGGWDYVTSDPAAGRLYVSHAAHVLVLDLKTDKILATLDTVGVHGIALAPELNRGFISNGGNGTVTLFDLTTFKPIITVKVGENPDAICYEPVTKRVFAFNGRSSTVSVIDATTGKVIGDISLPGKPEFAQADGAGFIFDNMEDMGLARWPVAPDTEPSALAIDPKSHRLFVGCGDQKLAVMDDETGRIVGTVPIGQGVDATAYDPVRHRVFASCGDGTLTVIDQKSADRYELEAIVPTAKGARTMAVDSRTGAAYLPSAQFGPPPAPTPEHPKPHRSVLPDTLEILVVRTRPAKG
jgi:YVTN family beta-propeller protein